MRLLQVNNVASMTGGTANCTKDIVRALPGVDHAVFFSGPGIGADAKKAFDGCALSWGDKIPVSEIELADVILFHNTPASRMPLRFEGNALRVYYQHSASKSADENRKRCDLYFCVSKWLAKQCGQDESCVLYQPVSVPKEPEFDTPTDGVRIGRICTPKPDKWMLDDLFPLYEKLGNQFPEVTWEFVGCPEKIKEPLKACLPRTVFYEASPSARGLLHSWNAMLYSGSLPESYGRTVCEAQRAGCIPIVRNIGAFPEQIVNGHTGFLCDSDEEFIAAAGANIDWMQGMTSAGERSGLDVWRTKFLSALKGVGK